MPNPTAATGRFLMDDGTWATLEATPHATGGANVFPFTYNTSTVESAPITGNQMRGNNTTFSASMAEAVDLEDHR